MSTSPRILTNMAFWQSDAWLAATESIYDLSSRRDPDFLPWWRESWRLFRTAPAFDIVCTMGIRESMAYAALCVLTGRPSRQVMCEVFIDNPRPRSPVWRGKTALYGFLARRAIGILTNCSPEVDFVARRYGVPRERVRYVPLNTTIALPERVDSDDGFILSAGRTLRDYDAMLEIARATGLPVKIICGRHDLVGAAIPPNVEVLREQPRDAYLDALRRARVVALPLRTTERATGQVVLLEAMALGKATVTTRSPGTVDLVRDGETGFLIEPGDNAALAARVQQLWNNPSLRQSIGDAAVAEMREIASAERHARLKLEAIRGLWNLRRSALTQMDG